jgi:hypothetical protein
MKSERKENRKSGGPEPSVEAWSLRHSLNKENREARRKQKNTERIGTRIIMTLLLCGFVVVEGKTRKKRVR